MRKPFTTISIMVIMATSCGEKKDDTDLEFWKNPVRIDVTEIKERGTLRAVVDNSSTSYYIYRGRRMGYEYEMLRNLSQRMGVQLRLVITDDIEEAFKFLVQGKADIIAMNLEETEERKQYASFSDPTNSLSTVLVQRTGEEIMGELSQLDKKTIHLRSGSVYKQQLEALQEKHQLEINIIEVQESSENMVNKVMSGEIDYTVVDNDIALVNATYYDDIDVSLEISEVSEVSWAVRRNSPDLLEEINQ